MSERRSILGDFSHSDNSHMPQSTSLPLLAGFVAVSFIWLVLRSFTRKGIKHIRGPPSPSFLFGESRAPNLCALSLMWTGMPQDMKRLFLCRRRQRLWSSNG